MRLAQAHFKGAIVENQIFQLQYAIDTFYFLVCGALVMWMAAGFAMLEAGLVRSKNTAEILTKNILLYAVASIMYMVYGYQIMYDGGAFLAGIAGGESLVADALAASAENGFEGEAVYSSASPSKLVWCARKTPPKFSPRTSCSTRWPASCTWCMAIRSCTTAVLSSPG